MLDYRSLISFMLEYLVILDILSSCWDLVLVLAGGTIHGLLVRLFKALLVDNWLQDLSSLHMALQFQFPSTFPVPILFLQVPVTSSCYDPSSCQVLTSQVRCLAYNAMLLHRLI